MNLFENVVVRERYRRAGVTQGIYGLKEWTWRRGRLMSQLLTDPPPVRRPQGHDWLAFGIGVFVLGMIALSYWAQAGGR